MDYRNHLKLSIPPPSLPSLLSVSTTTIQDPNSSTAFRMTIQVPDRSATAPDIRRFIAQVLESEYDTDPDFASQIAGAWRIGRGSELHDAKLEYFQQVFGVEIGFCLFRSVLEARDKQWQNSRTAALFTCKLPCLLPWIKGICYATDGLLTRTVAFVFTPALTIWILPRMLSKSSETRG